MKGKKMITLWAPEEVIADWKERAHQQHMALAAWLRMKADATDDLPPIRYKTAKSLTQAKEEAAALIQRASTAGDLATPTVKPRECLNRLRPGTWCGKCGATHT